MLQSDQTAAVAPSADLVAWSRLGSAYRPADLVDALEKGTLVEVQGMIRPAEDLALYRAEMAEWPGTDNVPPWRQARADWVEANDEFRREILYRLEDDGPLTSRDIPDTSLVPWRSTGWNNNRNVAMMLEMLAERGEVATVGRRGRERLWDLAERVYPDDPPVPAAEAVRRRNARRLRALGICRSRGPACSVEPLDVTDAGVPAVVDGVKGEWRIDPELLDQPFRGRMALLSPLDRLVYDRARMADLFDFDYQLEMYKPAAKRRWGYYALPILHGDLLVGKVDAATDTRARVLRINAVHEDVPFSPAMTTALDAEIDSLAECLGLEVCSAS